MVAAHGIESLDAGIGGLQGAEITRPAVVIENDISVKIVEFHGG